MKLSRGRPKYRYQKICVGCYHEFETDGKQVKKRKYCNYACFEKYRVPKHMTPAKTPPVWAEVQCKFCDNWRSSQRDAEPCSDECARLRVLHQETVNGWTRHAENLHAENLGYDGFTWALKESIRDRDGRTCRLCGDGESDRALDVHHIDYDRENADLENLVSLCRSCHAITHHNRKQWPKIFAWILNKRRVKC